MSRPDIVTSDEQSFLGICAQFDACFDNILSAGVPFELPDTLQGDFETTANPEISTSGSNTSYTNNLEALINQSPIDAADSVEQQREWLQVPRGDDDTYPTERWKSQDFSSEPWNNIWQLRTSDTIRRSADVGTESWSAGTTEGHSKCFELRWSRARHQGEHADGTLVVRL